MALLRVSQLYRAQEGMPRGRAPDVRVIVQMKEKILGLITNIHFEIQSDFHL